MRKRILVILLCVLMVIPVVLGLTACNKDGDYDYEITVWVGEGTKELTERQIAKFNETNEWGIKFKATVEIVSESKAVGNATSAPQSCADIYCFAQDQLARAVHANLLMPLNSASVSAITENCDEDSIEAAKVGDAIRAFPLTHDNGYFMYYDKRIVAEEHLGSLEDILQDCIDHNVNFSMQCTKEGDNGGSWYAASFFYAAGCKSEWTTDKDGNFTDYVDDFNSANGVIALKGLQTLIKSDAYHSSSEISDFTVGIHSGVVVSGIWGYKAAQQALGNNLGVAPLPSFTVDGKSYQLVSYLGSKMLGVKPQSDAYKAAYLQRLAQFLTNEECQKERFEEVGWGPSNKKAAETASSPALDVLLKQAKTTPQGQYPTNWWTKVDTMVGDASTSASDDTTLRGLLQTYTDTLNDLKRS